VNSGFFTKFFDKDGAMTRARRDGLYLVLLGGAIFAIFGIVGGVFLQHPISDFRFNYISVRCLMQNVDPYKQGEFLRVMQQDGQLPVEGFLRNHVMEMAQFMYPPTSFVLAPFGLLPWPISSFLWTITICAVFLVGAYLMWKVAADYAPILSGFLVFFILATGQLLLVTGNALGLALGLCLIAVWCIVEERFAAAGVLCLSVSLMIKPHDAALVWLYFLLAGGTYRKRALQTLVATIALSVPLLIWATHVSPHWLSELRGNLAILNSRGHLNDPGPSSMAGHGVAMVISLQSAISFFRDDPRFYNTVSYLVCGAMLIVWSITVLKSRPTKERTWLALAAISALTMLPVYHRTSDAKLLLLAIPACAMLWTKENTVGRVAVAVTTAGVLLTGEIQWIIYLGILHHLPLPSTSSGLELRMASQIFPIPLILLAVSLFYLWVCTRSESEAVAAASSR
jgi:Glycosyltransferase family 87